MAAFGKAILTVNGNNLITEAVAGGQIEFTRLETGSGIYGGMEDLSCADRLMEKRQEFSFLRVERVSDEAVMLVAVVSNEGLDVGYRMTEVGIYGKLKGSDEEVLCSVSVAAVDEADFIPPFNGVAPSRIILYYHVTVSADAAPCISVADDVVLGEISAECNRAQAAELYLMRRLSLLDGSKVDRVDGKQLSANDFTDEDKGKLGGIADHAEVNVQADWEVTDPSSAAFIRRKPKSFPAERWKTARNINGMIVDGSENRVNYGTCSTAAATAEKTVVCKGFSLVTGAEIVVKFTVTNSAASPTLNINGTGAKPIFYREAAIIAGYLAAGRTYGFRYNGAQYDLVGDIDTDVKYNNMSPATESAAGRAGLVPAPGAGKQNGYLRGDGTWVTPTNNLLATEPGTPLDAVQGKALKAEIDGVKTSFQGGVDVLYSKCRDCGATPGSKTPAAISTSIGSIYNNRYNAGYGDGRTQGQNDVKWSPNSYGLYTADQYNANYNTGRTQGQNDVKGNPAAYGIKIGGSYTVTLSMPWYSSFSKSGTINVSIKIVDGKINSVSQPGKVIISSDGNFVNISSNATLVED